MKYRRYLRLWFYSIFCLLGFQGAMLALNVHAAVETEYQKVLMEHLEAGPANFFDLALVGKSPMEVDSALMDIYQENGMQPYWVVNGKPSKRAQDILTVLDDALSHGLNPESYFVKHIHKLWKSTDVVGQVRLEILLTLGMMHYVVDQREGRIEPRELDSVLFESARNGEVNWAALREEAFTSRDMKSFLKQQAPQFEQYRNLMIKLAEYRVLEALGGWPMVDSSEVIKPGMAGAAILQLRKRLFITGELTAVSGESDLYGADLEEAVKQFQRLHGLQPDGVIGKNTFNALNVPVKARIDQIVINMERYRWLEGVSTDKRFIVVNIAGFKTFAVQQNKVELSMASIVGTVYHQTPVFSDMVEYIEFNPFWTVPPSIARNEMLPKLKKDSNYLKKQKMRLFQGWNDDSQEVDSTTVNWKSMSARGMNQYRIRQDPGPLNALGTLKIMFPNKYSVYLHDTPSHNLFSRDARDLSHGCIRLSEPVQMASWVLGGEESGWGIEAVKEVVASGKRRVVNLEQSIPVHILYRTAVVSSDGKFIQFFEDVYGRDKLLANALFHRK